MKNLLYLVPLFFTTLSFGQQNCNCEKALTNLVSKIENEYPGFAEKTKDTLLYNSLKKELIVKSKKLNDEQCLNVLKQYTSFFKDGHIWILPNEQEKPPIVGQKIEDKQLKINIEAFKKRIKKSKDKLEGIWKDENYSVGVTKTGENKYTGFIIESNNPNWKPKEIKFILEDKENITYYLLDHSSYKDTYELADNYILHINNLKANFVNQNIFKKLKKTEVKDKINELDGFYFKKLTDKSSMIRISSFNYPYIERIEKLISDSRTSIENSENLIIDIRNNGGGTDGAYKNLLPFIMTDNIRDIGVEVLATQGLIDGITKYKQGLIAKDSIKNKKEIKNLDSLVNIYKKNIGKFINLDKNIVQIDTIEIAKKSPKQIIILANKGVGSAAENFLLKAKQSKKVKVIGNPTAGVLDYANAYFFEFGCDNYKLLLPTYRSLRIPDYPIDNIGIQPDVYLDGTVEDWVKFALNYLEN